MDMESDKPVAYPEWVARRRTTVAFTDPSVLEVVREGRSRIVHPKVACTLMTFGGRHRTTNFQEEGKPALLGCFALTRLKTTSSSLIVLAGVLRSCTAAKAGVPMPTDKTPAIKATANRVALPGDHVLGVMAGPRSDRRAGLVGNHGEAWRNPIETSVAAHW